MDEKIEAAECEVLDKTTNEPIKKVIEKKELLAYLALIVDFVMAIVLVFSTTSGILLNSLAIFYFLLAGRVLEQITQGTHRETKFFKDTGVGWHIFSIVVALFIIAQTL